MFFFLREKRGRENLGSFHLVLFSFAQARLPLSLSQFPLPFSRCPVAHLIVLSAFLVEAWTAVGRCLFWEKEGGEEKVLDERKKDDLRTRA